MSLQRYLDVVDDADAFLCAAERPLPRVIWANPLRQDPAKTAEEVRRLCPEAEPLAWRPDAWRLPPEVKPGRWVPWMYGRVHGQEEASLLAASLVDAQPGERILDLCAAPGGKTAGLAVAMADRGTLVANDRSYGRLSAIRRVLDRLGVTCAAVTCGNGVHFPAYPGGYDRILVDAPCTCEGTSRKPGGHQDVTSERYRRTIVQIQTALLRRALRLVRPGGRVVYSTCTYAPEENEAVLEAASTEPFTIEPVVAPAGLRLAPGLPAWQGQTFRPDVVNAVRLWPHHNDTGGFFVAVLKQGA
ncbi:MAG: RsmB/NOP family class I SAM-dependent RNA methyltransferase [Myxococcales bacterium]|nr:RsmB/NOP family class I SAM-dependent RNA methyltransferase [Myxococcales bacterium]